MKNRIASCYSVLGVLLGLILWFVASPSTKAAQITLYSTGFEAPTFTSPGDLVGVDGWVGINAGAGILDTGIFDPMLGTGQAAYIGSFPPDSVVNNVSAWEPINYDTSAGFPLIHFSVDIAVSPSTNGQRDTFDFTFFMDNGDPVCGVEFSPNIDGINASLRDPVLGTSANGATQTITMGVKYTLTIDANFRNSAFGGLAAKSWTATINGSSVFSGPLALGATTSTVLGDIDAEWNITTAATPGDNYMVFDNYSIVAIPEPSTVATLLSGAALLVVALRRRRAA